MGWRDGRRLAVSGGALLLMRNDYSVVVADPGGAAWLRRVGRASFGIGVTMSLERRDLITAELCAACNLIALIPMPLHFKASLPGLACIQFHGLALPIYCDASVQTVSSLQDIFNDAATARLERYWTNTLRFSRAIPTSFDPFSAISSSKC